MTAGKPRLMIVQPNASSPSETFLRMHAERLPADVTVVHGGGWVGEQPMKSQASLARAWRKGLRLLRGQSWDAELTANYLAAFHRYRPQAVLAEYGETAVGVLDACRQACVPLIGHFHGYDASENELLERFRDGYHRLFEGAAAIVGVSQAMCAKLVSLGAPPSKVHWNSCGVDCNAFGGAQPEAVAPVFLAVGRFTEKKAPQHTLAAFAQVHRACPETRLHMIGFGPLLEPCKALANQLGVAGAVTFLGSCPPSQVQREMVKARAFVQHSVVAPNGDSEGTPVSVLEAGASGLPVVSTRHGGIPDVVQEGVTGFLVDEHDVNGMAVGMLQLVQDPMLAGRLGRAARERVAAQFSMDKSIARLWSIIEECMPDRPRSMPAATPAPASRETTMPAVAGELCHQAEGRS